MGLTMGLNIYVAGKTDDWERVRRIQEAVQGCGHIITHDWTKVIEESKDGADVGLKADERSRAEWADDDKAGVRQADLVIACVEYEGLCGTLIEIGMAMAYEPAYGIMIVGTPERNAVFFSDPIIEMVEHEDDVVAALPA